MAATEQMPSRSRSSALLRRFVALVVLLIAGVILVKIVFHIISGVIVFVMVIAALLTVAWAYNTLKR